MIEGSILVTGAAGLVGNAVCALLEESGQEVILIDLVSETEEGRKIIRCDVTDVHRLHEIVHGKSLGGVVHCGARSGPMLARDNPSMMIGINIVGTANVLELAWVYSASRFAFCPSTSAYGVTTDPLFRRTSRCTRRRSTARAKRLESSLWLPTGPSMASMAPASVSHGSSDLGGPLTASYAT